MPKLAIGTLGLQGWFSGDFSKVIDLVLIADQKGIDQVLVTDHVIMGNRLDKYPYGEFPVQPDYPWYEPTVVLAAIASATTRIRLATGIVIAPLRPAAVLAKQIATLDVISQGRVDIGFGVGWQKEEYSACGVSWDRRFDLMFEQVRACRELWSHAPASFHGEFINFDHLFSLPFPLQKELPIWFGIAPTENNIKQIAALGHGWQPMEKDPLKLKIAINTIRAAFEKHDRDPDCLQVRVSLPTQLNKDRTPDIEATLAQIPALVEAGVTTITILPAYLCSRPEAYEHLIDRFLQAKS